MSNELDRISAYLILEWCSWASFRERGWFTAPQREALDLLERLKWQK